MFAEATGSGGMVNGRARSASIGSADSSQPADAILTLHPGQILFAAGEPKRRLYRVIEGGFSLSSGDAPADGFGLPGAVLGLGFLDTHMETAQALSEARVECLPLEAAHELAARDRRFASRLSEAAEREFAQLRAKATGAPARAPHDKLAAYLVAASQINSRDGLDPTLIREDLSCGVLADWLGLDIDDLAKGLKTLRDRSLIDSAPDGAIRLLDIPGLERTREIA